MVSTVTDSHNDAGYSGGDVSVCVCYVTAWPFKVVVGRLRDATESNHSLYGLWPAPRADVFIETSASGTLDLISLVTNFTYRGGLTGSILSPRCYCPTILW